MGDLIKTLEKSAPFAARKLNAKGKLEYPKIAKRLYPKTPKLTEEQQQQPFQGKLTARNLRKLSARQVETQIGRLPQRVGRSTEKWVTNYQSGTLPLYAKEHKETTNPYRKTWLFHKYVIKPDDEF